MARTQKTRKRAKQAAPLSGPLRKALDRPELGLEIAQQIGLRKPSLDAFVAGTKSLGSDVLDHVGNLLGVRLHTPKKWPLERIHVRRIFGKLTAVQQRRLIRVRKLIAKELPDLIRRNRMAHDAARQDTISGALRRAVQTCGIMLRDLTRRADVSERLVCDFLTGEKALPSDAVDRLIQVLKLRIDFPKTGSTLRPAKAS